MPKWANALQLQSRRFLPSQRDVKSRMLLLCGRKGEAQNRGRDQDFLPEA